MSMKRKGEELEMDDETQYKGADGFDITKKLNEVFCKLRKLSMSILISTILTPTNIFL